MPVHAGRVSKQRGQASSVDRPPFDTPAHRRAGLRANARAQRMIPAIEAGDAAAVAALLAAGAHANDRAAAHSDSPLLVLASDYGHVEVVDLLLRHGADPCAVDTDGWSALHFAAARGNAAIVRRLVAGGASLVQKTAPVGCPGCSPLVLAVYNDKPAGVTALLTLGADPNDFPEDGFQACVKSARVALLLAEAGVDLDASHDGVSAMDTLHATCPEAASAIAVWRRARSARSAMLAAGRPRPRSRA